MPLKSPVNVRLKKGKGKKGKGSPYQSRFRLLVLFTDEISGDEGRDMTAKTKGKKARKWGEDGAYEADGNDILDFSSAPESAAPPVSIDNLIGSTQNSKFEIDDDDDDDDSMILPRQSRIAGGEYSVLSWVAKSSQRTT